MEQFPFGQPTDAIIQIAYSVANIQSGMKWWSEHLGVGPWYLFDRLSSEGATYRGTTSSANFSIAMAFSGHIMIELIQALDEHPSIYKEARERGDGFHHVCKATKNLPEAIANLEARGYTAIFQAPVPGGGRVCFLEGGPEAPGLIELVEDNEPTRRIFTAIWQASVDWDGSRPVRSITEILTAAGASPP
jgi:hypothetical protein